MQIALIGIETNSSGTADGVIAAPRVLREAGLVNTLEKHIEVEDYGNLRFIAPSASRDQESGIIAPDTLVAMIQGTHKIVGQALDKGQFPLLIGGDCPILLGCLLALRDKKKEFGLLFLDGHEDAYAPLSSPTGEAADMELAMALGLTGNSKLPDYLKQILPLISPEQVTLLGPRDKPILERENVPSIEKYFEFLDDQFICGGDVSEIGKISFAKLIKRNKTAWFHLDLDILSSEALPAVDYLQPGGLSWHELEDLSNPFFKKNLLLGWDITIYNPDLDPERKCAERIVAFIESRIEHFS